MIYIVSDSVGETAELVARAAASQFNGGHVEIRRVPYVTHPEEIPEILEEAGGFPSVIVFTLIIPELRDVLIREAARRNLPAIDIMSPVVDALARVSHDMPKLEPGLMRKVDEEYFRRVEAIEFAVKYDDGKDPRGISQADLVILGVSRTGKTPLCMYLAHKRIKAANVPLVPEVAPPQEIFKLPPHRLVGLTVKPEQLLQIRQERLKTLGLPAEADYANTERILRELDYAKQIFQRAGCSVIDVTNKAVEETASKVLEIYWKGERHRLEP
ncbi:pyruvate, water dikinase regulatory protein [Desulforudis sp. 1088]|uniref:pyruvate, water dikinase regulatory protein n=1 Tax=unclassified Candidatus Desulforudis TaxID=2635950 RepID=UPI003CE5C294